MLNTCTNCGSKVLENTQFCTSCGSQIKLSSGGGGFCGSCGTALASKFSPCAKCGHVKTKWINFMGMHSRKRSSYGKK